MMISCVMFVSGFLTILLSLYARIAGLFYFAAIQLLFCWVGRTHKGFRIIPIVLCLVLAGVSLYQSSIYGYNYYYYDFTAAISVMMATLLLVTMLPTAQKQTGNKHRQTVS